MAVSARTGAGIDELRAAIGRAADGVEQARVDRPTRLYIDRTFTLRGIGTVTTGTLWSGTIGAGDELVLQPSGKDVRVRSVQVHDRDVERAEAGQRVAVSLPGVERAEAIRGDALVQRGGYPVSYRLDVVLDELEPIGDGARVQVHVGTAHVAARVVRVGEHGAQLRLAAPVVAARGDRVILRDETTLGGGRVIDPAPPRHRNVERMALVERGDIAATVHAPVHADSLRFVLDGEPIGVERAGPWVFSRAWLDGLEQELRAAIEAADPIDPGAPPPAKPGLPTFFRCSRSSGAAPSSTFPARFPRSALASRMPSGSRLSSRRRACAPRRSTRTSSRGSWRRGARSFGSARSTRSALGLFEVAEETLVAECPPRARSRSPASETSSASAGAMPSSSSSASIRTGSRAA